MKPTSDGDLDIETDSPETSNSTEDDNHSRPSSGEFSTDIEFDFNEDEIFSPLEPCYCLHHWELEGKYPPSFSTPTHPRKIGEVNKIHILYNPFSGSNKGKKTADYAQNYFQKEHIQVSINRTEKKGHTEELCRTMDLSGVDVLCIIGGDGTIHEAINGLMKRADQERYRVPIGIIPAGTGNSLFLELFGSVSIPIALQHIVRGVHCPIDIQKITCFDEKGTEELIYSFNSVHWGLGSKVSGTAEKLRWMGKAVRYTTATLWELTRGHKEKVFLTIETPDGTTIQYVDKFSLIIANNIISAAKGMKMAPNAKINDGFVDLLLFRTSSTLDLFSAFKKTFDGSHTELPYVEYLQAKSFSVTPYKKGKGGSELDISEEPIDIDGDLKGHTPFISVVEPLAIRFIV